MVVQSAGYEIYVKKGKQEISFFILDSTIMKHLSNLMKTNNPPLHILRFKIHTQNQNPWQHQKHVSHFKQAWYIDTS